MLYEVITKLLHANGDRAGALRQYQTCTDILKKELEVEPDAATKLLFETIRGDASESAKTDPPAMTTASPLPHKPSIAVLPFANSYNFV